jgi:FkbH-like protein
MKLVDALRILRQAPHGAKPFRTYLACGFTPGHLQTFLAASLQTLLPDRRVEIETGLYGDIAGNLRRINTFEGEAAAVVLEWPDLDPRLGIRSLGGWGPKQLEDILRNLLLQLDRIKEHLQNASTRHPLVVSLPAMQLPPAAFTPTWQASSFEQELQEEVSRFGSWVARQTNLKLVNSAYLARDSSEFDRFDVQSEVLSGFPYRVPFASRLAQALAELIFNRTPKKGIITDLDDTIWRGILGEVGIEGISWSIEHRSHMHGLYQQLLRALSEEGVLIAVASKNDPFLVQKALKSDRLILSGENVFPVEAHWGQKSESVSRILKTWNVGAESVVFIDDSPMELAEVKTTHPQVECILFPKDDYKAVYVLLTHLRDLFGKTSISKEDSIRLESIRHAANFRENVDDPQSADEFLRQADAELKLSLQKVPSDPRALELVNKTNQFNLNGKRMSEAEWQAFLENPESFLLVAGYQDKYGPLGKIAVVAGRNVDKRIYIEVWVMSCRAFSRRIEHSCLAYLFNKLASEEIMLNFEATQRNGPFQDFLSQFSPQPSALGVSISKASFSAKCPARFHSIQEISNE